MMDISSFDDWVETFDIDSVTSHVHPCNAVDETFFASPSTDDTCARAEPRPSTSQQQPSGCMLGNIAGLEHFGIPEKDDLLERSARYHRPPDTTKVAEPEWKPPPKIGTRFSSGSTRILKSWLADHQHQPYPTVADIELMRTRTGLARHQIVTWFRNARRQRKTQPMRPPTPLPRQPQAEFISRTPEPREQTLPFQDMNPLQRWQNSPPEHEPVAAYAIARAMSGLLGLNSTDGVSHSPEDAAPVVAGSWQDDSSASSAATSQLSSSLGSAWSDDSGPPCGRFDRRKLNKRRRRRNPATQCEIDSLKPLNAVCYTFQCTFCTESFKTKHNWQRHENSMHLSLEQWGCSPQGPTFRNVDGNIACAFCGQLDPDHDHVMKHNYATCYKRCPEERVFYRKDHLQQHLKLVHEATFMECPMKQWRREMQDLRSRCGFCELVMDTWADRIDHLADHFKQGKSMADWKGDWGFDDHVLDMVENSIPPYLIYYERNSPWPFTTLQGPVETPVSAYELIKTELDYWMNHANRGRGLPSVQDLQYESCCIILGSEILSKQPGEPPTSWLRDLLMSSPEMVQKARIRPTKSSLKTRITQLKIHGKNDIFENCSAEARLRSFADTSRSEGVMIGHVELQLEASNIVASMESCSPKPSAIFSRFLDSLIFASTEWLLPFRNRANLGWEGSVSELASMIQVPELGSLTGDSVSTTLTFQDPIPCPVNDGAGPILAAYFQDDSNCYRRLTRELSGYVSSTLSPHNPTRHFPSDEELQHQARWIMFDNDDPWNQTPADNPNWLRDFKRTIGLIPAGSV
ncbi:Homeobox and C2H2 transcription factor [Fusarium keratoplasticum]|uniref:Homeobox and C2H2 transcription factor n=1 Tax=Fusarium keratoplasticum TaxID=1328300 RepID=A0ACC0RBF4_9HYPO|nr:Homeobox and C2H2 transcription factor [Fusarium keratoplasticum]KAI8680484.1 Homeobox and C2H2 transcription factor [Fusarium keratoplasticum]